jgi:ketosteroid isomerase-like protein
VSARNVEIVRAFYNAWGREEFAGPVELLHSDVEYVNPEGAIEPGTRHGLDEFQDAIERAFEGWTNGQITPERFQAVGDQVAVVLRYSAHGRSSGVRVEGRESALWTVRDGLVVRYEWFHNPEDAINAVGSSP